MQCLHQLHGSFQREVSFIIQHEYNTNTFLSSCQYFVRCRCQVVTVIRNLRYQSLATKSIGVSDGHDQVAHLKRTCIYRTSAVRGPRLHSHSTCHISTHATHHFPKLFVLKDVFQEAQRGNVLYFHARHVGDFAKPRKGQNALGM